MLYKIKQLVKNLLINTKIFKKFSVLYVVENKLLPSVLTKLDSHEARKELFLPNSDFITQVNQDIFGLMHNNFKSGYFIEIGANDGFDLSNTIYLEKYFGWDGMLIEANPRYEESLKKRNVKYVISAILDESGFFEFRDAGLYGGIEKTLDDTNSHRTDNCDVIKVFGERFQNILEKNNAPKNIDFISIDVEGGELPILKQMCELKDYRFKSGCIEHNFRKDDYKKMEQLLQSAGYKIVWKNQTMHDLFFVDNTSES